LPKAIAIIDDEIDVVTLFREILEIEGLQVCTFTDPIEAYNKLKHNLNEFSLVISDYKLPKMNGNELCAKLISINSQLKVILMSAYQDIEYDKSRFTFIRKPIPISKLLEIVNETLATENVPKTNHRILNVEA
jgi:DNA-binding NtrC family response regulator